MQRTHFTAHYILYNCVCDIWSSSELNLYCIVLCALKLTTFHKVWIVISSSVFIVFYRKLMRKWWTSCCLCCWREVVCSTTSRPLMLKSKSEARFISKLFIDKNSLICAKDLFTERCKCLFYCNSWGYSVISWIRYLRFQTSLNSSCVNNFYCNYLWL